MIESNNPSRPGDIGRRISVIGAGYVGLPTAVVLSHRGHFVTVAERNEERLRELVRPGSPQERNRVLMS
jgi:UDP-glucose 6-dehydrogenase